MNSTRAFRKSLSAARANGVDARLLLRAAEEFGCEERNRQLMMTRDGEAAARTAARRTADDVRQWAIGLYEVEVGGREVFERVAEVSDERHAFEEDFRQHDRRADVEIDAAAVQAPDEFGEQAKVRVRRRAE